MKYLKRVAVLGALALAAAIPATASARVSPLSLQQARSAARAYVLNNWALPARSHASRWQHVDMKCGSPYGSVFPSPFLSLCDVTTHSVTTGLWDPVYHITYGSDTWCEGNVMVQKSRRTGWLSTWTERGSKGCYVSN